MYRKMLDLMVWLGMRNRRVMAVDVCCIAAAVFIGYSMRFSYFFIGVEDAAGFIHTLVAFIAVIIGALFVGKTYNVVWTRASIEEYTRFAAVVLHRRRGLRRLQLLLPPRTCAALVVPHTDPPRAYVHDRNSRAVASDRGQPSQRRRRQPARAYRRRGRGRDAHRARPAAQQSALEAVGFIDDDPNLRNMTVASLKVLGTKNEISTIIKRFAVDTVLLAIPSATGAQMREYVDILNKEKVTVRVLPSFLALADGHVSVSRLRSVNLEDLLRRDPDKARQRKHLRRHKGQDSHGHWCRRLDRVRRYAVRCSLAGRRSFSLSATASSPYTCCSNLCATPA